MSSTVRVRTVSDVVGDVSKDGETIHTGVRVQKDTAMKYRKKPVVIDAMQYNPGPDCNCQQIADFIGGGELQCPDCEGSEFYIQTLEGLMEATPGDWVIRGVAGEHYPCKPEIFDATYERVDA